ncbi:hypothetical protein SAMN06265795_10976 [Noviherbaspirillum humi]|uniref:Uncharacterized protein n=1 Tax=Noviherbaspirillum humi TaxID=1688639 RepID=A0A239IEH6_9BURK|nr:hypothetical protein [Noviherbaspirillum humi]SNS92040.1 hypothetical protein SAMN06265795_10976 [Noviherbaspirillum humi]
MTQIVYFDAVQRTLAATEVEAKLTAICRRLTLRIEGFVWNHGEGMDHKSPHLLDISIGEHVIRMYFTDQELACYWGEQLKEASDARLEAICSNLQQALQNSGVSSGSTNQAGKSGCVPPANGLRAFRRVPRGKKSTG